MFKKIAKAHDLNIKTVILPDFMGIFKSLEKFAAEFLLLLKMHIFPPIKGVGVKNVKLTRVFNNTVAISTSKMVNVTLPLRIVT